MQASHREFGILEGEQDDLHWPKLGGICRNVDRIEVRHYAAFHDMNFNTKCLHNAICFHSSRLEEYSVAVNFRIADGIVNNSIGARKCQCTY